MKERFSRLEGGAPGALAPEPRAERSSSEAKRVSAEEARRAGLALADRLVEEARRRSTRKLVALVLAPTALAGLVILLLALAAGLGGGCGR